jgi:BASS family bile acid:Na+ symporter
VQSETIIQILTISALAGLLAAVGLRLTAVQVIQALHKSRFTWIVAANFVLVPGVTVAVARLFQLPRETAIGMILLGAAPFAPVVPVFARLARSDLALAAGFTSLFPVLSAFATPIICGLALRWLPGEASVPFRPGMVLLVLVMTITLPLVLGVACHHYAPGFSRRLLRPMEILSEATGALSLGYVTVTEFGEILQTGVWSLVAMGIVFEVCTWLGWWLGNGSAAARQVVAFGTGNRNIALALLIAIQSFPRTRVVSAVVANGLLLILLGLLHVAWWRWESPERRAPRAPLGGP